MCLHRIAAEKMRILRKRSEKMGKLNYDELPILPCLEDNLARIKEISGGSSDVLVNEFTAGGVRCALLSCRNRR